MGRARRTRNERWTMTVTRMSVVESTAITYETGDKVGTVTLGRLVLPRPSPSLEKKETEVHCLSPLHQFINGNLL